MTKRTHIDCLSVRQKKRLKHLANMRAAKARKRRERIEAGWEPETKLVRCPRFEFAIREYGNGEAHWLPLKSVRDMVRRVSVAMKQYR